MKNNRFAPISRHVASALASICIAIALAPLPVQVANAADTIDTLATAYLPVLSETVDASGFRHPGIGLTRDVLENMRAQVRAKKEPWNTYFNDMLLSSYASKTPAIKNVNSADPTKPRYYGLNAQGPESLYISDAITVYTQAILYYVTGDDTYRANAMRIIRLYEQMDPAQYAYYTDSHIHTGVPLSMMTSGAEILQYTSTQTPALAWTDDDTARFATNLVNPVVETFNSCNCRFMNQHLFTTIGAMSGSIYTGNRDRYNQAVEWFTVNKDAVDQGQNGAIKQLWRMVTQNDLTGEAVTPAVQLVEMGRDEAHGADDTTNAELLARMMMAQGTKVDPVDGTASTAANAVGPYEFLGDRILAGAESFGTYMVGHEIPWVPTASHTDASGNPTVVYEKVSPSYRGRSGPNTWELYYYYKYVRGVDMQQAAPNFTKFFATRTSYNWNTADGGGDFWMFIPKEAEAEGGQFLVKPIVDPYREAEDRFTALDENSVATSDGTASFVRVMATTAGSRLVVYGYDSTLPNYAIRIRTNGWAAMNVWGTMYQLPDTKGQWVYVNVPGSPANFVPLTITGNGTTVDIDHLNLQADTLLTPPAFSGGSGNVSVENYVGSTIATTLDLSATESNAAAVITYQVDNLPAGASFNTSTGAFSWLPAQAGTFTFNVFASDGSSVTSKRVTIFVGQDRQATVAKVTANYDTTILYVTSSLSAYNAVYTDMENSIGTASDQVYFQKLASLKTAAAGLQLLSPPLADGSLDFSNILYASDFGTTAWALVDGDPGTSVNYTAAKNQTLTMDFGPSFKVAANQFALEAVKTFPERGAGIAIFGSNDNSNWTRLTPGLSILLDDMQTLAVQDDLKTTRFRFFKIQMVQPPPGNSLLQLGEFRVFGTRYETVNKLSSVSLSSAQALRNRVIAGNTVKLSFVSTEPINNVTATIQGQPATVTTTDNLNWTATAVVNGATAAGNVKFVLNYKTAAGLDAEPAIFTTDSTSLFVSDQTGFISNLLAITTLSDSNGRNATDVLTVANNLFDSNLGTAEDLRVNGGGSGGWLEFDFRGGGTAALSRVELIGLQDPKYYTRINGAVVQGSNDNTTWTTISHAAVATMDWQTLTITDGTPYRYIRMYDGGAWYGNMTELRLYGTATSTNKLASASMSSPQALLTRIVPGNTVKLTFTAKEAINNVSATIQGVPATVSTADNVNFTATATLPQGSAAGNVQFTVNYATQDGKTGYPLTATTDGSALNLVDESDSIYAPSLATLIDPTSGRTAATTLSTVTSLFDGNLSTGSDFRVGTSGTGSYVIFDFKTGNQVNLSSVEVAASQDTYYTRINGVVIQGSNDNASWTTLTPSAGATKNWQTLPVTSKVPYRYLRLYNPNAWYGTMRELRLHGSLHAADVTAPTTTASAPPGIVHTNATVTLAATDNQGGTGVAATYYTVDGGAQQTGASVSLTTNGTHTVSYWSVDLAGNSETPHNVSVTLDKYVDVTSGVAISRSGLTVNRFTNQYTGTVTISNPGNATVSGPLYLVLQGLTPGVTVANKTGDKDIGPYITLPVTDLAPGQSVSVTTTFANPSKLGISYTPILISTKP
jgi:hypothetical protein